MTNTFRLLIVLLLTFLSPLVTADVQWVPGEKGFCCEGDVYGVFDLSGTWEGVQRHSPPVGTFTEPGWLYQGTGPLTRALWSINLVDQTLGEVQANSGQEIVQTYTGTYTEVWIEHTNPTGQCLTFPTAACRKVNRFASYNVTFSIRWCKAFEGFVYRSLAATEMNLDDTDSGLSIPSKMVINQQPGEFCPAVTATSSLVTYDYEGAMIIAAFSPGGKVTFSPTAPLPYDEVEFKIGDRAECGCDQPQSFVYQYGRKIGPAGIAELKGTLSFTVASNLPLDLVDPPFSPAGQFSLRKQTGNVRERGTSETDAEWQTYLETIKDKFAFADENPTFEAGVFTFNNVPLFDVVNISGRDVVKPARYGLFISGLTEEEYIAGTNPLEIKLTKFSAAEAFNLQAGSQPHLVVKPLDGIPIKKTLIDVLSEMSPGRFLPIENLALLHLNALESGSPTEAQIEGLDRAILAERMVRDGGRLAYEQIAVMLKGMSLQAGFLVDEVLSNVGTPKTLKDKKDRLANISDALNPQGLTDKGWVDVPVDQQPIKDAMDKYVSANFDLQIAEMARKAKSLSGSGLKRLKTILLATGVDEASASLVVNLLGLIVDTVFDTMIEQGPAGLKSVVKAAIQAAIESAQQEMFDTLPYAHTDWTDEALSYSREKFETWNSNNEATYRFHRGWAEHELVQLGVDAYSTLGQAQALQDIADGFNGAEEILSKVDTIPVFKKAKLLAKLGKFVTSALSYYLPLKGVYYDIPQRVEAGVAKSYGQLPQSAFPGSAAPGGEAVQGSGMGTAVTDQLNATLLALENRLAELSAAWAANDLGTLLTIVGSDTAGDLLPLMARAESELLDVIDLSSAAVEPSTTSGQMQGAFTNVALAFNEKVGVLIANQLELLTRILTNEFSTPNDPVYVASRADLTAHIERLSGNSEGLRIANGFLSDAVQFLDFNSPVVVGNISLTSLTTTESVVTEFGESFLLSATLRNLGVAAVSGVEAELSIPVGQPLTIDSTAIQVPGTGNLAANDGNSGQGPDELVVSWQVTYTGPLDEGTRVPLKIESRSTVVDGPGIYQKGFGLLAVSAEVSDPDGDGMPSAWETDHGLAPDGDDGEGDADDDKLTNAEEYDRETNPQVKDSDDDGINDGDEVLGTSGWLTDPIDDDTDDDGVLDGADGSPLDPTTSEQVVAPEPVLSVSTNQVSLTADSPQATVQVSNTGGGVLLWVAESANESLVIAGNTDDGLQAGSTLLLQIPAALDPSTVEGIAVQVRVIDATGTFNDQQIITVYFGEPSDDIFVDGFE